MKTKILGICVSILLIAIAVPAVESHDNRTITTNPSSSYQLKNAILFGRFTEMATEGDNITVKAVNLRMIHGNPFEYRHFISGENITFSNQYRGILLENLLIGSFTVTYPISTNSLAVMDTILGTIVIELYDDKMPITTENFITLANDWFYNGLVFHRVIENFVIQGGGHYPNGTLKISPYGPIELEIDPDIHHLDGTISMARTSDPNSATSQFFICDGKQPHLDGQYAAFGRVIDGMDVVRAISEVDTTTRYGYDDWPIDDILINSIIIVSP